ncbi:MAG: VOC family protein [Herpetosiphon sp.]
MTMLKRIDHIGIAVHDLDTAIQFYSNTFQVTDWERIVLPERHMAVAVTMLADSMIELIAPLGSEAAFYRFLQEHGEGVHHIAYEVDDLEASLHTVKGRGIRLVDPVGRPGIHETCVAFLHPRSTMGVLTELVEKPHTVH